jgi:hypothetical protein
MLRPTRLLTLAPAVLLLGALTPSSSAVPLVNPGPLARAHCGAGSHPETAEQGRVPLKDEKSGRAAKGYSCNAVLVGSYAGVPSNFKTLRYVDSHGRQCAYFDSSLTDGRGVTVLDMTNPARPVRTATLDTPAMRFPHESLLVNAKRGLLVATAGTAATAPGLTSVYELSKDCRNPHLASNLPVGVFGHESGFAPDGKTYYTAAAIPGTVIAIDLTDPAKPAVVGVLVHTDLHGVRISPDGNLLYGAVTGSETPGAPSGMKIYDVSQVQRRVAVPKMTLLSYLTWDNRGVSQVAEPVTIKGHRYVVEVDEFSKFPKTFTYDADNPVGAARIIDVQDPRKPFVVSNLRLEVNMAKNRHGDQQNDTNGSSDGSGYAAHYCAVPRAVDPGIVACSFLKSGIRVFDIHDPFHPKEIAYFNRAVTSTAVAPAFDLAHRQIWYADGNGFVAFRVTNNAWKP